MTKFIYGTGNAGKVQYMREVFTPLDLCLMEIGDFSLSLPDVDEKHLGRLLSKALWVFKTSCHEGYI